MSEDLRLDAIWKAIKAIQRRLTFAVGVPPAIHAPNHSSGSADPIDILDLDGYPNTSPADAFLREDGTWAVPAGTGDVAGPGSSTDDAFARFDGTTGKLLQDSTGASLDDDGRAVLKALWIPGVDDGNSGAAATIDWDDSNEHLLTLTDDVVLTFSNPNDMGRYVLVIDTGGGGFTPTYPANVRFVDGEPDLTAVGMAFLLTFLYLGGADRYLASFNGPYDLT